MSDRYRKLIFRSFWQYFSIQKFVYSYHLKISPNWAASLKTNYAHKLLSDSTMYKQKTEVYSPLNRIMNNRISHLLCYHILPVTLFLNSAQNTLVNLIIWLMLSHLCKPNVILLCCGPVFETDVDPIYTTMDVWIRLAII